MRARDHRAKGAINEVIGKVTGHAKTQAEGAAEKAAGKASLIALRAGTDG
jgi:uncharacterized protein YjbJ (UPF0337 family)